MNINAENGDGISCHTATFKHAVIIADPLQIRIAPVDERFTVRKIRTALAFNVLSTGAQSYQLAFYFCVTVCASSLELAQLASVTTTLEDVLNGGATGFQPQDILDIKYMSASQGGLTAAGGGDLTHNYSTGVSTGRDDWDINVMRTLEGDQVIAQLWGTWNPGFPTGFTLSLFTSQINSVLWERKMRKR